MNFMKTIINSIKYWVNRQLENKVDIEEGKMLSSNDYTTEEKEKLASIEADATRTTVNGMTGDVQIVIPSIEGLATEDYVNNSIADIPEGFSGSWNDLTDKPTIPEAVTDDHINSLIDAKMSDSVLDENGKLLSSVLPDGYPHGEPEEIEVLLSECTVTGGDVVDASALEDGKSYTVILDGVEYSNLVAEYYEDIWVDEETGETEIGDSWIELSNGKFGIFCRDNEWEFYFRNDESHVITGFTVLKPATLVTMSETFIPDTIARVSDLTAPRTGLILTSSTSGSSKQFKITIDDEGVITATEIVESAT